MSIRIAADKRGITKKEYIAQVLVDNGYGIDHALRIAYDDFEIIPDFVHDQAEQEVRRDREDGD